MTIYLYFDTYSDLTQRINAMDKIDHKILALLQNNARITNSEIARKVGMVPSGVLERIRKLEECGCIEEYTAKLNPEILNLKLLAFVFVRSSEGVGELSTGLALAKFPEIMEVHNVAGEDCLLLKMRLKDNKSLSEFLREKIGKVPTVKSTRTIIVLETTKETSRIYQSEQLKTDDT